MKPISVINIGYVFLILCQPYILDNTVVRLSVSHYYYLLLLKIWILHTVFREEEVQELLMIFNLNYTQSNIPFVSCDNILRATLTIIYLSPAWVDEGIGLWTLGKCKSSERKHSLMNYFYHNGSSRNETKILTCYIFLDFYNVCLFSSVVERWSRIKTMGFGKRWNM